MTAAATDTYDLHRWALSAAIVIGIHAALALTLTRWHEPLSGDEGTEAIAVDLAPFTAPPTESKSDLAPGPEQQQSIATPDSQTPKPEEKPQEKVEPNPEADVQLPADAVKPPDKQQEQPRPATPETSPPRPSPSAAQVASWHRKIALQVERHKGYPPAARARHETGTVELAFTIDRQARYEPAAWFELRGLRLSIRRRSTRCGARSRFHRRRRICRAKRSTSPYRSASTFAKWKARIVKTIAIAIGTSIFWTLALVSNKAKTDAEACAERCQDYNCAGRQFVCVQECIQKCRSERPERK